MDRRRGRRRERGTVMAIAALAAVTLLLFAGLALDVGSVWSSRGQSQHVADAVALAAAGELLDASGAVTDASLVGTGGSGGARAKADEYAGHNATIGNPAIALASEDVRFGRWDVCSETFDGGVPTASVNAVQVDVHLGGDGPNAAPPTFFSGLLGMAGIGFDGFEVTSTATAYLGYEGQVPAEDYGLPLAISSCNALGSTYGCCEPDFCAAIGASVLEPCADDPTRTCLAPELENACWTGFDQAISEAALVALIESRGGNSDPIAVGEDLELVADPLGPGPLEAIRERLDDEGPFAVKLPVVACTSGGANPCVAGSLPVTGSICFRVEGVLPPLPAPPEQIAGHFLCADDPDFHTYCRPSGAAPRVAGGCNYGVAADRPVLVQ